MSNSTHAKPRVYVGTYYKYNCGSIAGQWLDLDQFSDADEFLEACRKLHSDESDPEFMFQDFEGIPDSLISESSLSDSFWEWLALDDDDRERLRAVNNVAGSDYFTDIESALERVTFHGSMRDFAWEQAELQFEQLTDSSIWSYFDIESYERDLDINGYRRDDETGFIVDMTY